MIRDDRKLLRILLPLVLVIAGGTFILTLWFVGALDPKPAEAPPATITATAEDDTVPLTASGEARLIPEIEVEVAYSSLGTRVSRILDHKTGVACYAYNQSISCAKAFP